MSYKKNRLLFSRPSLEWSNPQNWWSFMSYFVIYYYLGSKVASQHYYYFLVHLCVNSDFFFLGGGVKDDSWSPRPPLPPPPNNSRKCYPIVIFCHLISCSFLGVGGGWACFLVVFMCVFLLPHNILQYKYGIIYMLDTTPSHISRGRQ